MFNPCSIRALRQTCVDHRAGCPSHGTRRSDLSGSLQGAGGVGGLIAMLKHTPDNGAAEAHLASYDAKGNLTALTSTSSGNPSAVYEYDAFGNTLRAEGPFALENPFRFSTKHTDADTGLV